MVFEAGLFGSALGMRRTFILHANGAKLPSDLLGLTSVRYDPAMTAAEMRSVNEKLRNAIESEGSLARIEGAWWQFSLTERTAEEPSAVSLLRISRDRNGAMEVAGRSWQEDGTCRRGIGAKPPRRGQTLRASSTTGMGNGLGTPTRRSSMARERS